MKKFASTTICFLIASRLFAQDCSKFLYMQKNKKIENTTYDAKGAVVRKSLATVTDVNTSNGMTSSKVANDVTVNGKPARTYLSFKCSGGVIMINMNFDNGKDGKPGDNLNFNYVDYPAGMRVGDHLKDATSQMKIGSGADAMISTGKTTNRLVVDQEKVTTPAGTWPCFKITYTITATVEPNKYAIPAIVSHDTVWYSPDYGIIKYQSNDLTTEITAIN